MCSCLIISTSYQKQGTIIALNLMAIIMFIFFFFFTFIIKLIFKTHRVQRYNWSCFVHCFRLIFLRRAKTQKVILTLSAHICNSINYNKNTEKTVIARGFKPCTHNLEVEKGKKK